MLENITINGRELLVFVILAVVFATVVYLLESVLFSRRRRSADTSADTSALAARIAALEASLALHQERLERFEAKPPQDSALDTQANTYAEAMRMARAGASARELAGNLGISRSEAELIIALQRGEA